MTTLVSYVFASNAAVPGVVVRGYVCGRYVNAQGSPRFPNITTSWNGNVLCNSVMTVPSNPIAQAFILWVHFYFTAAVPNAGQVTSIGSNIHWCLSNPYATATITGAFVSQELLQCASNPYNSFINPAPQLTLSVDWNPFNGDVLEVHAGYMEAL